MPLKTKSSGYNRNRSDSRPSRNSNPRSSSSRPPRGDGPRPERSDGPGGDSGERRSSYRQYVADVDAPQRQPRRDYGDSPRPARSGGDRRGPNDGTRGRTSGSPGGRTGGRTGEGRGGDRRSGGFGGGERQHEGNYDSRPTRSERYGERQNRYEANDQAHDDSDFASTNRYNDRRSDSRGATRSNDRRSDDRRDSRPRRDSSRGESSRSNSSRSDSSRGFGSRSYSRGDSRSDSRGDSRSDSRGDSRGRSGGYGRSSYTGRATQYNESHDSSARQYDARPRRDEQAGGYERTNDTARKPRVAKASNLFKEYVEDTEENSTNTNPKPVRERKKIPVERDNTPRSDEHNDRRPPKRAREQNDNQPFYYGWHVVRAIIMNKNRHNIKIFANQTNLEKMEKDADFAPFLNRITVVDREFFARKLGENAVHQGICVSCDSLAEPSIHTIIKDNPDELRIIALDQVQDPHNIGAVLRTAAFFGATAVLVVDFGTPEDSAIIAKSASGAGEIIPIIRVANLRNALELLQKNGAWVYGFHHDETAKPISDVVFDKKSVLLFGAEGRGLRPLSMEIADFSVAIPAKNGKSDLSQFAIDSLNVSNAVAVALFHATKPSNI